MKKIVSVILFSGILGVMGASSGMAQGPMEKFEDKNADKVEKSCLSELETYCQTVTPGEGRGAACLYARSDKLSTPCLTALYEAQGEFKNAVENVSVFVEDCRPDILKMCSKVAVGEGRILACLEKNKDKIAPQCRKNLKSMHGDLGKEKLIVP